MPLAAQHIGELVAELLPLLEGWRIVDVAGLPPADLLLILEAPESEADAPGETAQTESARTAEEEPRRRIRRLRVSAAGEDGRLHLQVGPVARHAGPQGPFFRTVTQRLSGGRLRGLAQVAGDRLVRLDCLDAGGKPCALIVELIGRHANLLLLGGGGELEVLLSPPTPGTRAADRLTLGAPWVAPAGGAPRGPDPAALSETLPEAPTPPAHARELAELAPLSWRVEASLGAGAARRRDDRHRRDLTSRLERRLRSARDHLRGLEQRARSVAEAERVRMDAELLTAHLSAIERGAKQACVPDAFEPGSPPRTIPLDPGLSPRRNAERLFSRYRKLLRVGERLPEEQRVAQAQLKGLESLVARCADEHSDVAALQAEAEAGGWLPPRQSAPKPRQRAEPRRPYHRFFAGSGSEIRVGRNARDNDELTFKHARGNDLWLHTADCPGSHVVLVLGKNREPDPEEVLDAATLAVHFSPKRDAGKADVHIARRKEVHKPRRAPAGLVTLSGGKNRRIRMEPERLARLLATRGTPRPGTQGGPSAG